MEVTKQISKNSSRFMHSAKKFIGTDVANLSLFEKVWLFAPITVWFSYRPLLRFGQNSSMYFELSVVLIYLLALAAAGFPLLLKNRRMLAKSKSVQLVQLFVLVSGASLLWTPNKTRGVLTFGVLLLLLIVFMATVVSVKKLKNLVPVLTELFIKSAVIMSLLSFVQLVTAIWFVSNVTLLCAGCTPAQFGFARPNVFTIEPQFFGNLLLAPALILFHQFLTKKLSIVTKISLFIVITALFLTLSRGAIFAFSAGVLVLFFVEARDLKTITKSMLIIFGCFISCIMIQGVAAAANPDSSATFKGAISTSVNQLSLGIVDFAQYTSETEPAEAIIENTDSQETEFESGTVLSTDNQEVAPNFDGYVPESTNIRLKLSRLAIHSWSDNFARMLFGVGVGGSGTVLRQEFPEQVNDREIVQNEYAELLLENGLLGFGLFTAIIASLFYSSRKTKWTWAIIVAFLVQWNFFSGYPNALHIYLVFIMLAVVFTYVSGSKNLTKTK